MEDTKLLTAEDYRKARGHLDGSHDATWLESFAFLALVCGEHSAEEVERLQKQVRSYQFADTPQARDALEREREAMRTVIERLMCYCDHAPLIEEARALVAKL